MHSHNTPFALNIPRCNRRGRMWREGWVRLRNEVHNLSSTPNVTRVINEGRVRLVGGHVGPISLAHMGEIRNAHTVLAGNTDGERGVEWIQLTPDSLQW
jgi:hypothetical protein